MASCQLCPPIIYLSCSKDMLHDFLAYSTYDSILANVWVPHGFPSFSHELSGNPTDSQPCSPHLDQLFRWILQAVVISSSFPRGFPMVIPWFSYRYPMCFPWISQTLSHLPSFSTRSKHSSRSFAPPRVRRTMGWPWNTMFGWW